jgi:hypothetical protein
VISTHLPPPDGPFFAKRTQFRGQRFVRDIADLGWEILRLRRAMASLLEIAFKEALAGVFVNVLPGYRRLLTHEGSEARLNSFARPKLWRTLGMKVQKARNGSNPSWPNTAWIPKRSLVKPLF